MPKASANLYIGDNELGSQGKGGLQVEKVWTLVRNDSFDGSLKKWRSGVVRGRP